MAGQLTENARYPALHGELPAVAHEQLAVLSGDFAGTDENDIFDDPIDGQGRTRLRLVILRDVEDDPRTTRWRVAATDLARDRGVAVTELAAQDGHPLTRLAGLVALADYASVYLALAVGIDPAAEG
jgi:glucose/mannose-6-phosphate isomerase